MIVSYPNQTRNYCVFSPGVNERIKKGESELPAIRESLKNPKSEDEIVEDLFILNCMIDEGVGINKVAELYPELSRYNNTDSPNIQTFLAGIYRKTKVPDAFGPLVAMLIRNAINSPPHPSLSRTSSTLSHQMDFVGEGKVMYNSIPLPQGEGMQVFDPNEEIGGAILDYLA